MNKPVPCLVCHSALDVRLAKGRKSQKPFLMLICPIDDRHFRGFISDKEFISKALGRLEEISL